MLDTVYKNSVSYYQLMTNLFEGKISEVEFQDLYSSHRHNNLNEKDENGKNGHYEYKPDLNQIEQQFKDQYYDILFEKNCLEALLIYEQAAKELNITGWLFFMGIWYFIDEYVREYCPSEHENFEIGMNVDEQELREKLWAAYVVLGRNQDRWLDVLADDIAREQEAAQQTELDQCISKQDGGAQ